MLLKANFEEKRWLGKLVKRGQLVTSRRHLAIELAISEQNVRTALRHLVKTNEISLDTAGKYTLVTIINYDKYQNKPKEKWNNQPDANQELTRCQPDANQVLTTTKEIKKNKKNKNNNNLRREREESTADAVSGSRPEMNEVKNFCKEKNFSFDAEKFYYHYEALGWTINGQPVSDWKALAYKWNSTEKDVSAKKEDKSVFFNRLINNNPASYDIEKYERFSMFG